uniref:Uncharacterized protein n=1 Tax=Oryza barthii TaxID=65489 RepID=A0A0D3F1W1_9ORYZ
MDRPPHLVIDLNEEPEPAPCETAPSRPRPRPSARAAARSSGGGGGGSSSSFPGAADGPGRHGRRRGEPGGDASLRGA